MRKLTEKLKSLDKGTVIRVAALAAAILNQIVAVIGATSFAGAMWYQILSILATVITASLAAWENNDFTYFARLATKVLDALQDGKITPDEVKNLFSEGDGEEDDGSDEKVR